MDGGGWNETDLEVDVNAFGRESETQETRKIIGGDSDSLGGFVAVPERDVVEVRSIAWIRLWDSVPTSLREGAEEESEVSISTSVMLHI